MPRDRENFTSTMDTVDEGYFETMGIPILRGRGFRASDDRGRAARRRRQRAVREALLAGRRRAWASASGSTGATARRSRSSASRRRSSIATAAPTSRVDFVYLPLAQHPVARMVLLVRSSGDPLRLVEPVKDVVRALDANMPMLRDADLRGPLPVPRRGGTRRGGRSWSARWARSACVLAIAGLYGLVAYNVSRRTREIGIRMAIGARPADVLRLVMGKGLVLVGIGDGDRPRRWASPSSGS